MLITFRFVFVKHMTAYDMRISDWSSNVCSSDLRRERADAVGETVDLALDRGSHRNTQPFARAVEIDRLADGRAAPFGDAGAQHLGARQVLATILVIELVYIAGAPETALETSPPAQPLPGSLSIVRNSLVSGKALS